jgi:hypothetical protein
MLLDGPAIAHDLEISPGTIRKWTSMRLLERRGTDDRRRALYDYDEVCELATRRGLVAPEDDQDVGS